MFHISGCESVNAAELEPLWRHAERGVVKTAQRGEHQGDARQFPAEEELRPGCDNRSGPGNIVQYLVELDMGQHGCASGEANLVKP